MKAILAGHLLALVLIAGCPPAPVPPVPDSGDASVRDGARPPLFDASQPSTPCAEACATITALCGPQLATCPTALQHADTDQLIRRPDGKPLTCACLVAAKTKSAVVACGVACR